MKIADLGARGCTDLISHPVHAMLFSEAATLTKAQRLEQQVSELTAAELAMFRRCFQEYDAATWDRQIEADALSGGLDKPAEKPLADHSAA